MADKKISALTVAATPLAGTEVLPIVQSGATVKVSVTNLTDGRAVSMQSITANNTGLGTPVANFQSGDQAGSRIAVINSGAGGQTYHLVTGNPGVSNSGFALYDNTNSATRLYVGSSTGDLTLNTGNLVQGTAAKGVNFTANTPAAGMTSQLLNWYEEGSWTPIITFGTPGDLAITYSATVQLGTYTRIGNRVIINFNVSTTSFTYTTASGTLRVTGLPFTSRNLNQDASFGGMQWTGITKVGYTQVTPRVTNNVSFIDFISSGSAVSAGSVTTTDTPSGGTVSLRGSITYEI
jgi:hypothetical protein